MTKPKKKISEDLSRLEKIVSWFEGQDEVDVEVEVEVVEVVEAVVEEEPEPEPEEVVVEEVPESTDGEEGDDGADAGDGEDGTEGAEEEEDETLDTEDTPDATDGGENEEDGTDGSEEESEDGEDGVDGGNGDGEVVVVTGDAEVDGDVTTVDNAVESLFFDVNLKATDRLIIFGDYERNLEEDLHIRTSLGFTYTARCWSLDFRFTDKSNDQQFEFKINLHGLGASDFKQLLKKISARIPEIVVILEIIFKVTYLFPFSAYLL